MPKYASQTQVPADRSRAEIERTLARYGATGFFYGWEGNRAIIGFVADNRQVKFLLPLPDKGTTELTHTPQGRTRTASSASQAYEQAVRQRWRALALVIKAKLEAVETGIVTFEDEFAMFIVLPDGRTVGEHVRPAIRHAYETGDVPELLPGVSTARALPAGSQHRSG
jgi:hypothetical protein